MEWYHWHLNLSLLKPLNWNSLFFHRISATLCFKQQICLLTINYKLVFNTVLFVYSGGSNAWHVQHLPLSWLPISTVSCWLLLSDHSWSVKPVTDDLFLCLSPIWVHETILVYHETAYKPMTWNWIDLIYIKCPIYRIIVLLIMFMYYCFV